MTKAYKKGQKFSKDGKTMQIISVNSDGTATYAEVDTKTGNLKQGFQGRLPVVKNFTDTKQNSNIESFTEEAHIANNPTGEVLTFAEYNNGQTNDTQIVGTSKIVNGFVNGFKCVECDDTFYEIPSWGYCDNTLACTDPDTLQPFSWEADDFDRKYIAERYS